MPPMPAWEGQMHCRHFKPITGVIVIAVLGGLLTPAPATADAVRITLNTWPGFAPLYLARDKGFFKKRGVEVEFVRLEVTRELYAALQLGRADMMAGAVGTTVLYLKTPDEYQYLCAADDSNGGDGIVAVNAITSLADLRGKKVGVPLNSVSEFYLNYVLRQAGIKEAELNIIEMSAEEAGKAFIARELDAAVTWEPWLSRAKATDFGRTLIDSSVNPGVVSDVIIAKKDFISKHPAAAKAVVAGWNDAVAFLSNHPQEAIDIMAKGMGGWLGEPKAFAESLETVKIYGPGEQQILFGTKEHPGPLYETVKAAIDIWSGLGRMKVKVEPNDLINYTFVND